MTKYLLGILLFLSSGVFAQSFYVSDYNGKLKRVIIKNTNVTIQDITTCYTLSVGSIAIANNTFYSANGFIQYKGTISGNTITNCTATSNIPLSNSLTVDENGLLYSVNGADLYTTDANNVTKGLGAMPYTAAGDLAFFKGKLYMASNKGIVEVNIAEPALSKLVIPSDLTIWGITTVAYSSTENKLYAMAINNNTTTIYNLDVTNNLIGNVVTTLPFSVGDAASDTESGVLLPIEINGVETISDCPYTGKGTVQVICENALADYSYTLNGVTNNTGLFNNVTAGNYTVTVKSATETVSKNVTVSFVLEKPTLNVTNVNPTCVTTGSIKISPIANGDLYNIQYGGSIYNFDKTFTDLGAGNYHFDILTKNGCKVDELDVALTREGCFINVTQTLVKEECDNPGYASVSVTTSPHIDTYTYQLDAGVPGASSSFVNVSPGVHKVRITGADDEKIVDVLVPDYNASKPNVQYTVKNLVCDSAATLKLNMADAANYKILYNGVFYSFDQVFTFTTTGAYHFEIIKGADGCKLKAIDIPVTRSKCEIELVGASVTQECDVAYKGHLHITSKPHTYVYTYKLNTGEENNDGVFSNLNAGAYTVTVSSIEDSKQINIYVPDLKALSPVVSIAKTDAECDLQGFVKFNLSVNSQGFRIKFGTDNFPFDHEFKLAEGSYDFTVLKPDGCLLDSYHVDLKKLPCDVMNLPNAVTPNGDGINDVFQPNQGSDATNYNLKIYSRTGMLLFNSNALQNGWRGDHNGKPVAGGVYYWVVNYTNNTGKNLNKSGSVTLIR